MEVVERLASLMQHLHLDAACFATQILGHIADLAAQFPERVTGLVLSLHADHNLPTTSSSTAGGLFCAATSGWPDDARKLEGAQMAVPHAPDSLLHPTHAGPMQRGS